MVANRGAEWRWRWNMCKGKISENVRCLDLGDGYVSVYTCQNELSCTSRFVNFIVGISIKKFGC